MKKGEKLDQHWTDKETILLFQLAFLNCDWPEISNLVRNKTAEQCLSQFQAQRIHGPVKYTALRACQIQIS